VVNKTLGSHSGVTEDSSDSKSLVDISNGRSDFVFVTDCSSAVSKQHANI
jgi:hypothetical protein